MIFNFHNKSISKSGNVFLTIHKWNIQVHVQTSKITKFEMESKLLNTANYIKNISKKKRSFF